MFKRIFEFSGRMWQPRLDPNWHLFVPSWRDREKIPEQERRGGRRVLVVDKPELGNEEEEEGKKW